MLFHIVHRNGMLSSFAISVTNLGNSKNNKKINPTNKQTKLLHICISVTFSIGIYGVKMRRLYVWESRICGLGYII